MPNWIHIIIPFKLQGVGNTYLISILKFKLKFTLKNCYKLALMTHLYLYHTHVTTQHDKKGFEPITEQEFYLHFFFLISEEKKFLLSVWLV